MNSQKKSIINVITSAAAPDFKRFELMEHFIDLADEQSDVLFLLGILRNDKSSIVRHEAAAQLLKIEQRKPHLFNSLKDVVIDELLVVVMNDKSLVAKHESVEALSYIGDNTVLPVFDKLMNSLEKDNELLDSLILARDAIEYRTSKKINASELRDSIINEVI